MVFIHGGGRPFLIFAADQIARRPIIAASTHTGFYICIWYYIRVVLILFYSGRFSGVLFWGYYLIKLLCFTIPGYNKRVFLFLRCCIVSGLAFVLLPGSDRGRGRPWGIFEHTFDSGRGVSKNRFQAKSHKSKIDFRQKGKFDLLYI